MIFMIFCDFSLIIHDISLIIHDFNDISLIIHDTSLFYLHLRHFRFYTYVTSVLTPTSLPVLHLHHVFTPTSLPVLHLRHFRFYTYVTSVFTPTSLPVLYLHHFFTPTSLPVWQLRHFRFHNYVTFLHLHSNARFVKTFIFLTLILVAWEIWRHNLILHQILIYSKKISKTHYSSQFCKDFFKNCPKNPIF